MEPIKKLKKLPLVPRCWKTQDGEWKAAGTVHEGTVPVGPESCRGNPRVSVLAEGGPPRDLESNGL